MQSAIVIAVIAVLIVVLLFVGTPLKPMRFFAHTAVKLGIGVLLLFFVNVFGGAIGLHIPINIFTVIVSGFLGISGIISLSAIQLLFFL